jgi:tricarballylate dehydrogenase
MTPRVKKLVVVGHGAAGLAAALSAAEQARERDLAVDVTVLEKSLESEAGGNTRWSPSYMRLAAPNRIEPTFEEDMREYSGGLGDRNYYRALAQNAVAAIGWLQSHGIEFTIPIYYLSVGPPRIQPTGGGRRIVERLTEAARQAGVKLCYGCSAKKLLLTNGKVSRTDVRTRDGVTMTLDADAVVLATGGFQGNAAMMRTHFGEGAATLKLISPGTRFDTGDGIVMATAQGASVSGDWKGMHIEPVDPRSAQSAPVVLVYPYGIVVDRTGRRFCDEGAGLVHETWETLSRNIHFGQPNSIAYAILDSRMFEISGFQRAIRSEVPPFRSETIEGLAASIGVPAGQLRNTIDDFNAAATFDVSRFDATRRDGLAAAATLRPPKSNWARPIQKPPYLAYPLVGAIAYTFGGLATNERAEVLSGSEPIPGLYAAGETTGHFYGTAPNAVSVLRALVFGRIAGRQAVDFLIKKCRAGMNSNGDDNGIRQ